jgi:hypothetical protein
VLHIAVEINGQIYCRIAEPVPKRERGISLLDYLYRDIDFFLKNCYSYMMYSHKLTGVFLYCYSIRDFTCECGQPNEPDSGSKAA